MLLLPGVLLLGSTAGAAQEDAEAREILTGATIAMAGVQSFQFLLTTEQGETVIMDALELEDVTGAVQRPDRFRAVATANIAILEVDVEVIGIGTQIWVKNPLAGAAGGEEYIQVDLSEGGAEQTLAELVNPDRILLRAVDLLEDPVVRGEDEIDGVQTTVIEGTFDPSEAIGMVPGTPVTVSDAATQAATQNGLELAGPVPTLIWIDGDGLVRRVRVEGPILTSEATDVVRRLDLFAYNEPVEIEAPVTQ
jgi:hypothetical protein